jgi:carbon monoxide dehydrogenase subunit G
MVTLKSQEFLLQAPLSKVCKYLAQTQHYQYILPPEQITDFQFTPTGFSFKAAGQIQLGLEIQPTQDHELHFKGVASNPFAFDLFVRLQETENVTCGQIEISADLNMMMKMLVEKPLQKLIAQMATNLAEALKAH